MSSSLYAMGKLSKTTSPQKLLQSDCIILYNSVNDIGDVGGLLEFVELDLVAVAELLGLPEVGDLQPKVVVLQISVFEYQNVQIG